MVNKFRVLCIFGKGVLKTIIHISFLVPVYMQLRKFKY